MGGFQRSAQLFFVLAFSGGALLFGAQGCSSSGDSTEEDAATPPFGSSGNSSGASNSSSSSSSSTSSSGGTDAGRDGATGDGGNNGACLNDTVNGAAPQCPANQCNNSCQTINNNFKKGVAADAIKNLTQQICQGNNVNTTVNTSVGKACVDATGKAFCDGLVAGGCMAQKYPMFATQCAALTNALSGTGVGQQATGGRKAFRDCLNNPNNGLDCTSCQEFVKGRR